jgi:hypothetical protein
MENLSIKEMSKNHEHTREFFIQIDKQRTAGPIMGGYQVQKSQECNQRCSATQIINHREQLIEVS